MSERRKLPNDRIGITHKVKIGDTTVYVNTGEYDDGTLGEVFVRVDKEGGELRVYDSLAILISISIQSGVPLELILGKLENQQYEPAGITSLLRQDSSSSLI